MTSVHGGGADVAERDEQEFVVAIPGSAPRPEPRPTRISRVGAALFWVAFGWWLFAAVRVGSDLAQAGFVDGSFRQVPGATVLDAVQDATDGGGAELVALVGLSLTAAIVLLVRRGRRLLGSAAVVLAAASVADAWWHLVP
ncbi:hypothetical protein [Intrasporangium sp. DVR]|uniref:hypothetical protein n=1 Tax=Intrasporangium sp. DVR TaxID=3127867 RepID=UPI00313A6CE5